VVDFKDVLIKIDIEIAIEYRLAMCYRRPYNLGNATTKSGAWRVSGHNIDHV